MNNIRDKNFSIEEILVAYKIGKITLEETTLILKKLIINS